MAASWFERLWSSVAERARGWITIPAGVSPLVALEQLSHSLVSEQGEASGAALAQVVLERYAALDGPDRDRFLAFLAGNFVPDPVRLRAAAVAYCDDPQPAAAMRLAQCAEPPRQELLRRLNMANGGTAALVAMRAAILDDRDRRSVLAPLEADLRQLFASWFNRGFLELRRIDWHSPAAILEKLIAYEAVHAIAGWDDLRRRLAADRRCFAFFHPALVDEPLIFVEVALTSGLADSIQPLIEADDPSDPRRADTAIFYSISNCQRGLRGISFGNFLIKQVVAELKAELPGLRRFATLSPVPGFRSWLDERVGRGEVALRPEERAALAAAAGLRGAKGAFRRLIENPDWYEEPATAKAIERPLTRLCARFLTEDNGGRGTADPVARFHLGNGARLERVNFLANTGARGRAESHGIMVNYLYDLEQIEANHEAFVHHGRTARSEAVAELLRDERGTARVVGSILSFRGRTRN